MQMPEIFGFYAILTDPVKGYEYLTKAVVDHRIAFVQLRMKKGSRKEVIAAAETMRRATEGSETRFIVNDYPDIAVEVGADGIHVGQDDLSVEEVRKIVGEKMIVGLSTHSPSQTAKACTKEVDYVGVGPVYTTPTKEIPDPQIGLGGMKEMLDIATVPGVCLGGISLERLPAVLESGAKNFSLVRPLCGSEQPEKVLKKIVEISRNFGIPPLPSAR